MDRTFDIFQRLPDGDPIWVSAVQGLEEAQRRLREIAVLNPGDYFIFDARRGQVIAIAA